MPLSMQTKSLKMQFSFFGPGLGIMRKASQNISITGPAISDNNFFVLIEVYFSYHLCFSLGSIEWFLFRPFVCLWNHYYGYPLCNSVPLVLFIYIIYYFCWQKKKKIKHLAAVQLNNCECQILNWGELVLCAFLFGAVNILLFVERKRKYSSIYSW